MHMNDGMYLSQFRGIHPHPCKLIITLNVNEPSRNVSIILEDKGFQTTRLSNLGGILNSVLELQLIAVGWPPQQ